MDHALHTVDVAGFRLAYRRAGRGHPLLLFHGGLGDSREWRRQLDGLAADCDVIAVDAPGCGGSADPVRDLSLADYADLMAGFCTALGVRHPDVGGSSFGSVCALVLHRYHPGLARSLLLASAYAGWAGSLPAEEIARRKRWAAGLFDRPVEEWAPDFLASVYSPGTDPSLVAEALSAVRESRAASLHLLQPLADADLRDVLPTITVPTLLLYGEDDQRAPTTVAAAMHEAIPGSRLEVLPGVGHGAAQEAPETFNRVVREFLRGLGPGSEASRDRNVSDRSDGSDRPTGQLGPSASEGR